MQGNMELLPAAGCVEDEPWPPPRPIGGLLAPGGRIGCALPLCWEAGWGWVRVQMG